MCAHEQGVVENLKNIPTFTSSIFRSFLIILHRDLNRFAGLLQFDVTG